MRGSTKLLDHQLPSWVHEAIRIGELTDSLPNRRYAPRKQWHNTCVIQPISPLDAQPLLVRGLNISRTGVGFIAKESVIAGTRLRLVPIEAGKPPVVVRVVHCTRTIQGFKVGCEFATPELEQKRTGPKQVVGSARGN